MVEPVLAQLRTQYPNDVQTVFRHFPLPSHPQAKLAAMGAEAAGLQGKFFEFTYYMMSKQEEWSGKLDDEKLKPYMSTAAESLGLDKAQFEKDLASPEVLAKVDDAIKIANTLKLDHTPYIFVNHNDLGEMSYAVLPTITELYKLAERAYKACPNLLEDLTKDINATIHTTKGDIDVVLYTSKAPMTVSSFVFLAKDGWYDNVEFHRVIPGFMAQTGDPSGSGAGGPGYQFGNEVHPELAYDGEGYLGMANSGPDTNGSQFFITYAAQPALDGKYTIFGKVTKGMDILKAITAFDPSTGMAPTEALDKITGITIH